MPFGDSGAFQVIFTDLEFRAFNFGAACPLGGAIGVVPELAEPTLQLIVSFR